MKHLLTCFLGMVFMLPGTAICQAPECPYTGYPCPAIINGRLHTYQYPAAEGHPFCFTKNWIQGRIIAEDVSCSPVELRYDIYQDQMLMQIFSEGEYAVISLNPTYYDTIILSDHHFVPASKAGIAEKYLPFLPVYIEILFSNKNLLLASYSKHLRKGSPGIPDEYIEADKFWLVKGGNLFLLNNKRTLLKVLNDRKKEIRQFIRHNNMVKIDNPENLTRLVAYYESLSH